MPVPIDFLRGVLGVIGLACAFMTGRTLVAVRKGWTKLSRLYGWVIRTTLCLVAVAFRHSVDEVAVGVWVLSAAGFAFGVWAASQQKPHEDLSREIFPE